MIHKHVRDFLIGKQLQINNKDFSSIPTKIKITNITLDNVWYTYDGGTIQYPFQFTGFCNLIKHGVANHEVIDVLIQYYPEYMI